MNLSPDSLGKVWCPKINDKVSPDPTNLSGCAHCAYCTKSHKDGNGRFLGITCKLVPKIQFCERQKFEHDGEWICLIEPDLAEYKQLTGHIEAEGVPKDFRIPRPVTFTQCLLCAVTGRKRFLPIEGELARVSDACKKLSKPEMQAKYPPPVSTGGKAMRSLLETINPQWAKTCRELEVRAESPVDPNNPEEGEGMGRIK